MAEMLFAIETADTADMMYTFNVDGAVSPARRDDRVTSIDERNDTITSTSTGYKVDGATGNGYGDAYTVEGELTNWSATQGTDQYTLLLGGERVSPSDFPLSTQPNRKPSVSITSVDVSLSQVSASASASDPDGNLSEVSWSLFKSGSSTAIASKSGESVTFTFPQTGTRDSPVEYRLEVVATDDEGATGVATTTVRSGGGGGGDDTGNGDTGSGINIDKRTALLGLGAFGVAYAMSGD